MFDQDSPAGVQKRLPFLAAFIILVAVLLFVRLWYLQAIKGDYYYAQAESNRIRPLKLRPPRGIIYDRTGRPLVENVLTFDISLVPEDAANLDDTIAKLSKILDIEPKLIRDELDDAAPVRTKYQPVKIDEEAPWKDVAMVESHQDDLPGAIVEPEHRRHYPYAGLASHQLGYIGKITLDQWKRKMGDIGMLTGQTGLEKVYDKYLRGIPGKRMIQVNASGKKVKDLGIEEPQPGTDLYLTLDLNVQRAAEEGLGDRAGAVVAMDPNTGELLALASHPAYDPNLFPRGISPKDWKRLSNDPSHPLYNRAIQSVYPPGSTFKIIVALAGLDAGVITPDDKVTCNGFIKSGRRTFRCWKKNGHGSISLHRALVESCDVYFYTMGARIGWDRVAAFAKKFGLGSLTGVNLPDEKPGLIPTTEWKRKRTRAPWHEGDTFINSIGQGFVLVSPIQACQMISLVANGGHFYRPLLLKQTRSRETGVVHVFSADPGPVIKIDPEDFKLVRDALVGVVNEPGGTGHWAASQIATVAGKTGTAQVIAQDRAEKLSPKSADHAWFVGYAPAENPKIAVAVLVEHGGHGGSAAAPIARKVIEEYLGNAESKTAR
jgi:penicillin-binding protein 2